MSEYTIVANRLTNATAEARSKQVAVPLATAPAGRSDALAPVELLLAAVAAAVLGGTEHAAVTLRFTLHDANVSVRGRYQGTTLSLAIDYELAVATDEPDGRLVQFHELVRGSDSVRRLGATGSQLTGQLRRIAS